VCDIVVKTFTFAISSPDEFLYEKADNRMALLPFKITFDTFSLKAWRRFKSFKVNLPVRYGKSICVSMPNLMPIGRTFAEMWPILNFSRWRPSAILDLCYVYLNHPRRVFVGLRHCAKFGWNRFGSFDNNARFNVLRV